VKRAVFIDKDGTLVEDVPFNVCTDRIRFTPKAFEALSLLSRSGFEIWIISNQSGVAHGYFPVEKVRHLEKWFTDKLDDEGIPLAGFYFCPHHVNGVVPEYTKICECRKPRPGLLHQASRKNQIDLTQSWFIGDILDDVEAGHRAGCRSILLNCLHETQWHLSGLRLPDKVATDLWDAAVEIVSQERI
jgi:D-glycero-D-manno-heptose 1,7-bisphosphate phosphatase